MLDDSSADCLQLHIAPSIMVTMIIKTSSKLKSSYYLSSNFGILTAIHMLILVLGNAISSSKAEYTVTIDK